MCLPCCSFFSDSVSNSVEDLKVSGKAFLADLKFYPYYDGYFQLYAIDSLLYHTARAIYNLAYAALYTALLIPTFLLSPCEFPKGALAVGIRLGATAISALTAAIIPLVFTIRSLTSCLFGYIENSDCLVNSEGDEQGELDTALTICA